MNISTCNCSRFPQISNVLIEEDAQVEDEGQRTLFVQDNEHEIQPDDLEEVNENTRNNESVETPTGLPSDEVLYSETFSLKGSTFHKEFQHVLEKCKQIILENRSVEIKLSTEPVNVNDENAIVVQAKVSDCYLPIGYIPGRKIRKVDSAVNKNAITNVSLTRVQYTYIWGAGEHMYIPFITITKK